LFERYTERARRSIFFARYEASVLGTPEITSEELLLGILREDKTVASQLGDYGTLQAIRKEVAALAPPKGESIATSVDLPLSHESKRALAFAAEEAERLNHKHIGAPHLVLGLLRVEDSGAAQLLRKHGMELEHYRAIVAKGAGEQAVPDRPVARPAAWHERQPIAPQAKSLQPLIEALQRMVDNTGARLRDSDTYGDQRLKRTPQTGPPWTRKEALGHLIDWNITHQQWLMRALTESKLKVAGYPDQAAVRIQHYAGFPWTETVDLWVSSNRLLIHALLWVPENRTTVPCRIGIAEPVTLAKLLDAYLEHCQDIVGQILARLD
jgi:hypothetical protein